MTDIRKILEQAISSIQEKGADKGQIFITESENREFNVDNGEFSLFRTLFDQDINIIGNYSEPPFAKPPLRGFPFAHVCFSPYEFSKMCSFMQA